MLFVMFCAIFGVPFMMLVGMYSYLLWYGAKEARELEREEIPTSSLGDKKN